jgi:subfamily B ATP-binding cassette protein MsbA
VDGISERSIIETLKSRAGRATTIVISHHRKTLAFCDDVVIVRDGRIQASMPLGQLQGADMDALYRHGSTTTAA